MNKTALFLALVLMLSSVLLSCKDKKRTDKIDDTEENKVVIAENGKCNYKVIYPDQCAPWEKEVALYIRDTLEYYSGSDVEIATDWVLSKDEIDPNTKEILVGNTNRQESQDVEKSITVAAHDNKIVVRGITRNSMYYAAGIFVSQYIKNSENMLVSIPENLCVEETVEKADGWALDAMPVMDGVKFGAYWRTSVTQCYKPDGYYMGKEYATVQYFDNVQPPQIDEYVKKLEYYGFIVDSKMSYENGQVVSLYLACAGRRHRYSLALTGTRLTISQTVPYSN